MKSANESNDMDIRLNREGEIDIEYYRQMAQNMRAAYLAAAFVEFKQGVKRRIVEFYQKFICLDCQPSH